MENIKKFKNLSTLVGLVGVKSPLQKKKIQKFISSKDQGQLTSIEGLVKKYLSFLESEEIAIEYAIDSYLGMCAEMLRCQLFFMRNDRYPIDDQDEAYEKVYSNEAEMKPYMIGLAISQFLWESHYQMFLTFREHIKNKIDQIESCLDIGPGHGLYLQEVVELLGTKANYTAIDISPVSLDITKQIVKSIVGSSVKLDFIEGNMLDLNPQKRFDFITMGEVIEHVEDPLQLLIKMYDLMSLEGSGFVSTCVNCPAKDHVYHFKFVDEIGDMLKKAGFKIEIEKVLPVEELPMEEIILRKITINYCAIVSKI